MSTQYKIESGIPIPAHGKSKYPWLDLEIGQSFEVPGAKHSTLGSSASLAGKRYGRKFTARATGSGVRVWRTE